MANIVRAAAGVGAVGALAAVSAVALGRVAFRRQVAHEVENLFERARGARPTVVTEVELAGKPEPVQRWLRAAGIIGKERPITVRLKQEGQFRPGIGQGWMPIRVEQYYTTAPPGFIWFGLLTQSPFVSIAGRDKYVAGKGEMDIRALSLFRVLHLRGPELDQGSLLRYLSEIVWFPAAALIPAITWEARDAHSARAVMRHEGVTVEATFFFTEAGDVSTVTAERYRTTDDGFTLTPWSTPISAYTEFHGVRVPRAGEAVWTLPTGDFPYARVHITDVGYNHAALYQPPISFRRLRTPSGEGGRLTDAQTAISGGIGARR